MNDNDDKPAMPQSSADEINTGNVIRANFKKLGFFL